MTICNTCWNKADLKARVSNTPQIDCYLELMNDPETKCSHGTLALQTACDWTRDRYTAGYDHQEQEGLNETPNNAPLEGVKPPCDACNDTGYVFVQNGVCRCGCMSAVDAKQRVRESQIPKRFRRYMLTDFVADTQDKADVLAACKAYVAGFETIRRQPRNGLLFMGEKGAGKTMLMCAVMRELIGVGYSALFWNETDLFMELRATMRDGAEQAEDALIMDCERTDILGLDDVGRCKPTDYVVATHYTLINRRYEDESPLFMTTNQDMKWIETHLGPQIQSRLKEMCNPIVCPWDDYRLREWGKA